MNYLQVVRGAGPSRRGAVEGGDTVTMGCEALSVTMGCVVPCVGACVQVPLGCVDTPLSERRSDAEPFESKERGRFFSFLSGRLGR